MFCSGTKEKESGNNNSKLAARSTPVYPLHNQPSPIYKDCIFTNKKHLQDTFSLSFPHSEEITLFLDIQQKTQHVSIWSSSFY
ncbi:hypothetical protein L2E82_16760 [Cichorium intybus]|uniref:Uncharacterized protein n=1 Tax=Cichorium intybus TaxID=13427 RepID=A0ACB9F7P1_CICIN|nr:hypothetical protein L2E82_16760 [Cichorium intybus]